VAFSNPGVLCGSLAWAQEQNVSFDGVGGSRTAILERAWPVLTDRRDFYDQILRDLRAHATLVVEPVHGLVIEQGAVQSLTSDAGRRFFRYISPPRNA
jgi:hypothetical protein